MSGRRPARLPATIVAVGLSVAAGPAEGADAAVFLKRLSLPVAGDDIAYGHCVTSDPHTGETFVCDPRTNRILIFDAEQQFDFQIVGGADLVSPEDLAVDPDGLIVVLVSRGARRLPVELDFDGELRRVLEPVGMPADVAAPDFISVAISGAGDRIYLSDAANRRLWITDRDGRVIRGVDLGAELDSEERVGLTVGHVDVYGDRVLVTLPMNGRVQLYTLDGEPRGSIGDLGSGSCQIGHAAAAAIDRDGVVLVLDMQRMMVTRWRPADNRCLSEHIGFGNAPGYLYFPNDLTLDPRGFLTISQSAEGRVQVFEGLGAAPPPPLR